MSAIARAKPTSALPTTTVTVDIATIGAGGVGVARVDGRVVFVPRTAPGDQVEVRLDPAADDARFLTARLERLIAPGAGRVEPACAHYTSDDCGGCQLQHLSVEAQRDAKAGIIRDAFQRIAKRPLVRTPEVRVGPSPWRYRRSLSLHFRPLADGGWRAGLNAYHTPGAIFTLSDCLITREPVVAALQSVVKAGAHLPVWSGLRMTARESEGGIALTVEGGEQWAEGAAQSLLATVPVLTAIWWHPHRAQRRLVADRRTAQEPGASFAQVNADVASLLRTHLLERVRAFNPRTVIDAYAGAGDTAVPLALGGVSVTAIELDADASRWSATRLPPGSTAIAARVEDALPRALPADVVIVNPPRDGLAAKVTNALDAAHGSARAILYVSCNPATLARDVARLPHWTLSHILAFDMFPQTSHVETVCELVPEAFP